jgi:hypothetical protein
LMLSICACAETGSVESEIPSSTALASSKPTTSVCYSTSRIRSIANEGFKNCRKLNIQAKAGSYVETYAKQNEIPFSSL